MKILKGRSEDKTWLKITSFWLPELWCSFRQRSFSNFHQKLLRRSTFTLWYFSLFLFLLCNTQERNEREGEVRKLLLIISPDQAIPTPFTIITSYSRLPSGVPWIIQLSYTVGIPIFWLVDLCHVMLGCDETTSLTSLSWCSSRGVNSTHHCHCAMASVDSNYDESSHELLGECL